MRYFRRSLALLAAVALVGLLAADASALYAKNLFALIPLLTDKQAKGFAPAWDDGARRARLSRSPTQCDEVPLDGPRARRRCRVRSDRHRRRHRRIPVAVTAAGFARPEGGCQSVGSRRHGSTVVAPERGARSGSDLTHQVLYPEQAPRQVGVNTPSHP